MSALLSRAILVAPALLAVACGSTLAPGFEAAGASPEVKLEAAVPVVPPTERWGPTPFTDLNDDPDIVEVELTAREAPVVLTGSRPVTLYTYNGQSPGPTLQAKAGDRVIVHFTNQLPEPTTVHWHGLRIPDSMDGSPRIQTPVPAGGTFTYDFVVPEAGTFWYHPHVRSNEQVEKGLYGAITITEPDPAREPHYPVERTLVLDDVLLSGGQFVPFLANQMEGMHGRFGNTLLLNGQDTKTPRTVSVPRHRVERWRVVNTANARTLELGLTGATFRVIGTDGGLLRAPYTTTRLELPVGQRFDLEVTFDTPGEAVLLSYVLALDANNNVIEQAVPQLLVTIESASDDTTPTTTWESAAPLSRSLDRDVTLEFDAVNDPVMGLTWRINDKAHAVDPLFTFQKGDTVRMKLTNLVGPEHPFHLHGQFFEVLDAAQPGLKDTVLVPGLSTVEIIAYFDNPGRWMAHCHILEHAELGMMAEVVVTP